MKSVAHRGKMPIEKWVFRGKMGVIGPEKKSDFQPNQKAEMVQNAGPVPKNGQNKRHKRLEIVTIYLLFNL